jgi:general secretion pathway protein L
MLAEIGAWWLARMAELVPAAMRSAGAADTLLLRPVPGHATAFAALRRRRGRVQPLGVFALAEDAPRLHAARRRRETLTLATGTCLLRRTVTLPLAAERGLATLLHYEMDRLTPFPAEDVLWDGRLIRRDRDRGSLQAELVLLPRAAVAEPLQALAGAGLLPGMVEAPLPDGGQRSLPLEPPDPAAALAARRRLGAGLALCAALAAACIATPLLRQSLALADVEAQIEALRPRVAEAQALQRRLSGAGEDDALTAGRAHAGDTLTALAALTDALPDDTYLSQLSLHHRTLTMEGQSTGAATRLIAALAAEPHLRDPAFTAPVVRGDIGNEIFALQVAFAP